MPHTALWTASEIAAVTQGTLNGDDYNITGISIDTRHIENGDLFIPLKGPNFDGHDFIDTAIQNGAAGFLSDRKTVRDAAILIKDSFTALHDLGAGARARSHAKIMAVTGSVGKTSVKAMLHDAFAAIGVTHASTASLNNHWGVPLSLARMPRQAEYAVFEIGMNHAGEITPLSKLVAPHLAIITTVAPAHIAHFDGIESIALAKAEIFQGMDVNGVAVLPRDSAQFTILLAEARTQGLQNIVTFGEHEEADIRLISCHAHATHSDVTVAVKGQVYQFTLGLAGYHQALNALSVIAALDAFGQWNDTTRAAFAKMQVVKGRGNVITRSAQKGSNGLVIIDDTHNASPIAIKASLKTLALSQQSGQRIVALGDMLELGDDAPDLHADLAEAVLACKPDLVLLAGSLMKYLANKLPKEMTRHYPDSIALASEVDTLVKDGDIILVKGSHGSRMDRVVDALSACPNKDCPYTDESKTRTSF